MEQDTSTRPTYPEWFIGGPWHGEDKTRSEVRDAHYRVVARHTSALSALLSYETKPEPVDCMYEERLFGIGETALTIWVDSRLSELDAATLLAEILLKPHERVEVTEDGS